RSSSSFPKGSWRTWRLNPRVLTSLALRDRRPRVAVANPGPPANLEPRSRNALEDARLPPHPIPPRPPPLRPIVGTAGEDAEEREGQGGRETQASFFLRWRFDGEAQPESQHQFLSSSRSTTQQPRACSAPCLQCFNTSDLLHPARFSSSPNSGIRSKARAL